MRGHDKRAKDEGAGLQRLFCLGPMNVAGERMDDTARSLYHSPIWPTLHTL